MSSVIPCWTAALALLTCADRLPAAEPVNFLIVMADDCTYNDLPLYGGENARTPNIDRLASQGLTFNRAYVVSSMCQPCRAELYSGLYPMRNGCAWNHSACRPTMRTMPHYLGELGYRVGLAGKTHIVPREAFPFEMVEGFDRSCTRNPTRPHRLEPIREFITRDRKQPFCLVVALVEPHVPWVMGDASEYPPGQIELPPNLADTPRTRRDFANYLAEITYMDGQVGEILDVLDEAGAADSTLVLFTSEQGAQFPGCKWTAWDTGLRTALVARWPGRVAAATRTDALVQYADVLPTLLDAARRFSHAPTPVPDDDLPAFDGTSFLPALLGRREHHRQYVYGMHNNIPEGPPYPIRTVSDGTYRYIRNLTPGALYIEKHLMGSQSDGNLNNPYWATWLATAGDNPHTYRLVKRYMLRPAEQLYHTAEDPYELTDLAGCPHHAEVQARLSAELDRWMQSQGDPGAALDTRKAFEAARRGDHLYVAPDGP